MAETADELDLFLEMRGVFDFTDVETNEIHHLDGDTLELGFEFVFVEGFLERVEVEKEATVVFDFFAPDAEDFSHGILLESTERDSLENSFLFISSCLPHLILCNFTTYLIVS